MRCTYPPVDIVVSHSIHLELLMVCLAVIAADVPSQISQNGNMLKVVVVSASPFCDTQWDGVDSSVD